MTEPTLYERLGGQDQIDRLVDDMYRLILADEELAPFFVNTSMEKQKRMQAEFFSAALGGEVQYSGMDLVAAHRDRGITRSHVTRFVDHLFEALKSIDISDKEINEVCGRIGTYAKYVVDESASAG